MRRRRSIAALAATSIAATSFAAAGLSGCAGRTNDPVRADPATASLEHLAFPYALYTHCGVNEANIQGRWYAAETPLSDGHGNPPAGWGNPYQSGTMTIRSATRADFTDSAGHRVTFILRPNATGPRQICS